MTNFICQKDELDEEDKSHIEELYKYFIVFDSEEDKTYFGDFIENHENEFREELSNFNYNTYSDIPTDSIFKLEQSLLLKNWYLDKYKPYQKFNSI